MVPPEGKSLDLEADARGYGPGVFYAFRPDNIEKIITETQARDGQLTQLKRTEIRKAPANPIV